MGELSETILEECQNLIALIVLYYPFATPLSKIQLKECNDEYAKTNGIDIFINPNKWVKLNNNKKIGLLLMEYLHIAFFDVVRGKGKDLKLWQQAAKFSASSTIIEWCKDINAELIDGELYDSYFNDMSTEEIYLYLKEAKENPNNKKSSSNGNNKNNNGAIGRTKVVSKDNLDDENMYPQSNKNDIMFDQEFTSKELGDMKLDVMIASEQAKKYGKLPIGLERIIQQIFQTETDWKTLLSLYFKNIVKTGNIRSYQNPKKWSYQFGIILPGDTGKQKLNIVLILDTSGSIKKEVLEKFASEVKKLLLLSYKCTIITADTKVHEKATIRNINEVIGAGAKIKFKGGGGTNFEPALLEAAKLRPDICIYLTDGVGKYGQQIFGLNVIWALTSNKNIPPFGKYIYIN